MDIHFAINSQPVAQGRPKFYRRGDYVGVYDPKKSKDWKAEVKRQALANNAKQLLEGPLKMTLVFRMHRPKSLPKKVKYHIKKPDVSNLTKGIEDALEGICYPRDQQIVHLDARKEYAENGFIPCVLVSIKRVGGEII